MRPTLAPLSVPTLEGRHVRLDPMAPEHLDGLCAVGLDPELWRWIPFPVKDREEMRVYIDTALDEWRRGVSMPFVTRLRDTFQIVGSTRFANIDLGNRRMEIGWTWIGRAWQRTPVNTEAKYLMLRHGFEERGCARMELKTDALNEQSRAAIARIGAKEEGILRRHVLTASGRMRDTVYFSILEDEWPGVKQKLLARLGQN